MRKLLLGFILIAGCATQSKYEEKVKGWVGTPIQNRIDMNGLPTRTHTNEDGTKVYEWANTSTRYNTSYNGLYNQLETEKIENGCVTDLTVNQKGVITSYSYRGDSCKSR